VTTTLPKIAPTGKKTVPAHLHSVAGPAHNPTPPVQATGEQHAATGTRQSSARQIGINTNGQHTLLITVGRQTGPSVNH